MEGVRSELKVSELNTWVKERAYHESLHGKYEVLKGRDVESVEQAWKKFIAIVKECNKDVCGMRVVEGARELKGVKKLVWPWPKNGSF